MGEINVAFDAVVAHLTGRGPAGTVRRIPRGPA